MSLLSKLRYYNLADYKLVYTYKFGEDENTQMKLRFATKHGKKYHLLTTKEIAISDKCKKLKQGSIVAVLQPQIYKAKHLTLEEIKNFEDYLNNDKFLTNYEIFD